MEIKNSLLKQIEPYRSTIDNAKIDTAKARTAGEAPSPAAQGDRVSLSPSALLHTVAHTTASKSSGVRQEKVDAVKERLARGEYEIDSKSIAKKLLENDALLASSLNQDLS